MLLAAPLDGCLEPRTSVDRIGLAGALGAIPDLLGAKPWNQHDLLAGTGTGQLLQVVRGLRQNSDGIS